MPAPIAVFAFNRADNLARPLRALSENELADQSSLTIFCDGPRTEEERQKTDAVRRIARAASGFAEVTVIEREENRGLKNSLIAGISAILEAHDRIIVVEDDILTSPYFLKYMNDALDCYADVPNVGSVSGYCVKHRCPAPPETFFLRGGECWGWATWRDRWRLYSPDGAALLRELRRRKMTRAFDFDGCCPSTKILEDAVAGRVDSWFMMWTATLFLRGLYTLYPSRSLVLNIGFASGTHSHNATHTQQELAAAPVTVRPQPVAEDAAMLREVKRWYRQNMKETLTRKMRILLKETLASLRRGGILATLHKISRYVARHIKK